MIKSEYNNGYNNEYEIDEWEEFASAGDFFESDPDMNRTARTRIQDAIDAKEDSPSPGQVSQYALYRNGYTSTTPTVQVLPPGCYDINQDSNAIFASPAPAPAGLLLELPEMRSEEVINIVENFWISEKDYKEGNDFVLGGAAYKAGVMIYGPPGCHAKGTKILMFDGTTKNVENVSIGDKLMGPDSTPREVLKLASGRENMVKITPTKGESFIVNMGHILHLTPSGTGVLTLSPINMTFRDWTKQGNNFKERYKLTRTGIDFQQKELPIEPYLLGIWLGDGTSHITDITTMDIEIKEYLEEYAERNNLTLKHRESDSKGAATTYGLTNGIGKKNPLLTALQELELIRNKHIPYIYKTASRTQRLEILAGLMDSDGHLSSGTFDFVSKFDVLADDVVFLARSLGFAAYKNECQKSCQNNFTGTYFRVSISGDIGEIPCKLPRKQAEKRKQIKSVLRTGFSYEILPEDEYYGFSLDRDHLYLTGDFTIHHNTGKSCTIKIVSKKLVERGGTVFYASIHPGSVMNFLMDFSRIEKTRKCIVILEDIDALIQNFGESMYLEMLDSAKSIDNVMFIATTNYPDRLDPRIYNRPGRFSSVVKIGFPGKKAREAYLKAILKNHRDVDFIVDNSGGFSIDHLSALINAVYREKKDLDHEIKRLRTLFKIPMAEEAKTMGIGVVPNMSKDDE